MISEGLLLNLKQLSQGCIYGEIHFVVLIAQSVATRGLMCCPFVFCEIYEYCMTFEETASPDKSFFFFTDYPPPPTPHPPNSRMLVV